MNRTRILVLLSVIGVLVIFSGCTLGDTPVYLISFNMDGVTYIFTDGFDNPGEAEGCFGTPKEDFLGDTYLAARDAENPNVYVELRFQTTSPVSGSYDEGTEEIGFDYFDGENNYKDGPAIDDFTFVITEYGDVGGVIMGTFSGDIELPEADTITNGIFVIQRKADNSIGVQS